MKLKQLTRVTPEPRIHEKNKIYDLILGATGSFYISFDELEKNEYIKLKTRPHKNLGIKKKMQNRSHIYYYKQVGYVDNGKEIFF